MKAKNLTKAFVRLFVVAIVIGVLVWPTPKDARAGTTINISIKDTGDFSSIEGLDGLLHYSLYLDNEEIEAGPADELGGGCYSVQTDLGQTQFDSWSIRVDPPPIWLEFPGEPNPTVFRSSTTTNFTWIVNDTRN